MKNKFYLLIVICGLFLFNSNVYAISVDEVREAVVETAESFYRKGEYVQYDSFRKSGHFTPEDATSQNTVYTVCSNFIYTIYYNALGIKIPYTTSTLFETAKQNSSSSNVLLYTEDVYSSDGIGYTASYNDASAMKTATKNLIEKYNLEVGDILNVWYANGSGHVLIITDFTEENGEKVDATLIESWGVSYNLDSYSDVIETNGSIQKRSLNANLKDYYTNKNHTSYAITKVAIMRFINSDFSYISDDEGYPIKTYSDLTSSAKARLNYKMIDISKTSTVISTSGNSNRKYASPNDSIIYTIEIKNNSSSSYSNLQVVENLSEFVSLVDDGGATKSGNTLTWNIDSISASETKTITYTVKIPNNSNMIGKYVTSTGTVGNIASHTINHYIGNSLTIDEKDALISKYSEFYNNNEQTYGMAFVSKLYKEALDIDLSSLNGKTFSQILTSDDCSGALCIFTINNDLARKINFNNLYGIKSKYGSDYGTEYINPKKVWDYTNYDDKIDRAREILTTDLQIGDIIITPGESDGEIYSYIYIDDGKLSRRYVNGSTYTNLVYKDGTNGNITIDKFLADISCDSYIILRPAQLLSREYNVIPDSTVVPNTGKSVNMFISLVAIFMIMIGMHTINSILKNNKHNLKY